MTITSPAEAAAISPAVPHIGCAAAVGKAGCTRREEAVPAETIGAINGRAINCVLGFFIFFNDTLGRP